MTCHHKQRLTGADRNFLRGAKITPYECRVCEEMEAVRERLANPPRLRLEEKTGEEDKD